MLTERREHPRASISGSMRYWSWNRALRADVAEISAGGVFLKTEELLPAGAHLTLRLELPGICPGMTLLGQVARTVAPARLEVAGMGVRFIDVSPSQRALIIQYVESRTAKPAPAVDSAPTSVDQGPAKE